MIRLNWLNKPQPTHAMYYCDGCGEDYPITHLVYMSMFNGHFCDKCSQLEEE